MKNTKARQTSLQPINIAIGTEQGKNKKTQQSDSKRNKT